MKLVWLRPTWNEKCLDYEIKRAKGERKTLDPHREVWTFMTRALKQPVIYFYRFRVSDNSSRAESLSLKARTVRLPKGRTWNQKNLDYEIETVTLSNMPRTNLDLKSKEPRLRDWNISLPFQGNNTAWTWNQKNLDYEIET